jgi:hypothetical protein
MIKRRIILTFSLLVFVLLLFSLILADRFSTMLLLKEFKGITLSDAQKKRLDPFVGNDPTFPLSKIEEITKTPLKYLGNGGQAIAFVSADDKYVFKFFLRKRIHKNIRIKPFSIYHRFFTNKPFNTFRIREEVVKRYATAFARAKEKTGLVAIHLLPENQDLPSCTIVDYNGKMHQVDLNETLFVVQKKGECIDYCLSKQSKQNRVEIANKLENLLEKLTEKGFINLGKSFNHANFALVDDRPIMIDLGHLVYLNNHLFDLKKTVSLDKEQSMLLEEKERLKHLLYEWKNKNL